MIPRMVWRLCCSTLRRAEKKETQRSKNSGNSTACSEKVKIKAEVKAFRERAIIADNMAIERQTVGTQARVMGAVTVKTKEGEKEIQTLSVITVGEKAINKQNALKGTAKQGKGTKTGNAPHGKAKEKGKELSKPGSASHFTRQG